MNEILKAMEERRSVRKFKPDMPRREDLEAIIEAGLYAASAMGKQSAIAVAVTNRELRDRISDDNRKIGGWGEGFDPFYGAPAILIVLAPKNWPNRVYDGSLMMGNMMLAAHSLGLGSIWIRRPEAPGGPGNRGRVGRRRPLRRGLCGRRAAPGRGAQSGQSVLGGVEDFSDVRRRPEVKFPIFSVDILISKLLRKEG